MYFIISLQSHIAYSLQELSMKLQQLTESGLDQQSTFRSELAKKEMVVLELSKKIEVNILIAVCVFAFCMQWHSLKTCKP